MASSIYVVAAMAGNFWQESTLNPALWEGFTSGSDTSLNKGYGLGQWTNTNSDTHGRLYQMRTWMRSQGYSVSDGNGQCEYIVTENTWYPYADYPEFPTLQSFLTSSSTDIERLTHAWNQCWEGIHDESWNLRVTYAQDAYSYIIEHYDDGSITAWKRSGSRYLTNDERRNNSVMLWRYFGTGRPQPVTDWMYGAVRDVLRRLIIHA